MKTSKFLEHIKNKFKKIVVVDTEFQSDISNSYCTKALCAVYKDLKTEQTLKIWDYEENNLAQHHFDFEETLFVCFYATAEVGYFLKQLMGRPPYIFDCWTEYAKLYKNNRDLSLLAASTAYSYPNPISKEEKEKFRDMCIKQNTWNKKEREEILNYCEGDVLMNEHVFYKILNDLENICGNDYETLLEQAMARGQTMACYAKVTKNGMSIDIPKLNDFNEYWLLVKNEVIKKLNSELNLWDDACKFSHSKFHQLIKKLDLLGEWPTTPMGKLKTNKETFELFDDYYPEIKKLKRIFNLLNASKLTEFAISEDARYRPYGGYKPFGTHTGRCTPSSKWIFGTAKWARSFIKPPFGCAMVNLDFKSQETFIAAVISGDEKMLASYKSGDFYMNTAILAGMAPTDATKETHPEIRKIWKTIVLATNYGQGARGMAKALKKFNKTYSEVAGLLMKYKEIYKTYFDWAEAKSNHAQVHGYISTSLGWDRHFPYAVPINPRSLMNWPVQSEAGEILRNALIRLLNANIKVCATVHDSFLIECQLPELNEQIRIAKQCMIDAGTYIVGAEGMQVDVEIHRGNFKPEPADQELFNLIFEEIEKYKTSQKLNQGQVTYPNKVRSIYI
jgi:DNA polymerase-1